ncbi:MAG: hypothetical protein L6R48_09095 [Planctomycetes bacterium]|nr:hypothetical protein [Planctomycetota bacterium]
MPVAVALAALAGWWGWRRYGPAPGGPLAGFTARACRSAGLALLVLLAAGPSWRTTTTTVVPGRLVVAVDASASMEAADGPGGSRRIDAAAALARALAARSDLQLRADWRLVCQGGRGEEGGRPFDPAAAATVAATGPSTPLGDELQRLVAGSRPDLLVVVSDGRVTSGSPLAAAAAAWEGQGRDLRVLALAAGSDRLEPELLIDAVEVNREAALDELEPVTVRLAHRALPPGPLSVRVLVDGQESARAEVAQAHAEGAALAAAEARLEVPFRRAGPARVRIEVAGGGRSAVQELSVEVRERRLAVLLLERQPRYEARYLREALKRDKGITLHAYLADGRWRRWGPLGPDHLPLGPAELGAYDVVILGDLGPDAFRAAELEAIEAAVRRNGAGLVWMPGETGATAGFARTRLGELLPVELPDAGAIARGYLSGPRQLRRTAAAAGIGLLESGGTAWEDLPRLLGACPVAAVRPGTEVMAEDQDGRPLVAARAYGSGRALLVGVDDTWRWRRGVGDRWLHRFHSQLLRFAAAGHRADARAWRIAVNPRRAAPGETVAVVLEAGRNDEPVPERAALRLRRTAGEGGGASEIVVPLVREGGGFAARLPAPGAGTWTIEAADGPEPGRTAPAELVVAPPADERRDPRADRPALVAFTGALGGEVFDDPAALVAALPADLARSESRVALSGLWDTVWALLLLTALFATDWAIRRHQRMP